MTTHAIENPIPVSDDPVRPICRSISTLRLWGLCMLVFWIFCPFFITPALANPPATGPWVIEIVPTGSVDAPFSALEIQFNDTVTDFTIDDITVSGPGASLDGLTVISGSQYVLNLTGTGLDT